MKKINEQQKSKIEEFMAKQGKTLKPAKQPNVPKDSKKVTKKEIEELTIQMLKDNGYLI